MTRFNVPLRFAVIGARRGRTVADAARSRTDGSVVLAAICDPYAPMKMEIPLSKFLILPINIHENYCD